MVSLWFAWFHNVNVTIYGHKYHGHQFFTAGKSCHEERNILKPESFYLIEWWRFTRSNMFVENFKAVSYLPTHLRYKTRHEREATLKSRGEPMVSNCIHDNCWLEKFCSMSPGIPSKNALEPWALGDFTSWAIPSNGSNQSVRYDGWIHGLCQYVVLSPQWINGSFSPQAVQ